MWSSSSEVGNCDCDCDCEGRNGPRRAQVAVHALSQSSICRDGYTAHDLSSLSSVASRHARDSLICLADLLGDNVVPQQCWRKRQKKIEAVERGRNNVFFSTAAEILTTNASHAQRPFYEKAERDSDKLSPSWSLRHRAKFIRQRDTCVRYACRIRIARVCIGNYKRKRIIIHISIFVASSYHTI